MKKPKEKNEKIFNKKRILFLNKDEDNNYCLSEFTDAELVLIAGGTAPADIIKRRAIKLISDRPAGIAKSQKGISHRL